MIAATKPKTKITPAESVEMYIASHDISRTYQQQLRLATKFFHDFAGPIPWSQVTEDLFNAWVVHETNKGLATETIRSRRGTLLVLWRAAYDAKMTKVFPHRVRKVKRREQIPTGFLREEVHALLKAADETPGYYKNGIRRRLYWRAFLLIAWDTALRLNDILAIKRSMIPESGRVVMVQQKTGHRHVVQLSRETIRAIDAVMASGDDREEILPLAGCRRTFFKDFRELRRLAGLKAGSSKWLRRASASYVEAQHPGTASKHLGHRSPELAKKHYLDPRVVPDFEPVPPALELEGGRA